MAEWFKYVGGGSGVGYVHRPSGAAIRREPGERPSSWLGRLATFMSAHPAAREVREATRAPLIRLAADCPFGARVVFEPGETLVVVDADGRRVGRVTVAGVQPPLPAFDDEVSSYLLSDGRLVEWDGERDRWRLEDPNRPGLGVARVRAARGRRAA